jgi:hypothetical protein
MEFQRHSSIWIGVLKVFPFHFYRINYPSIEEISYSPSR